MTDNSSICSTFLFSSQEIGGNSSKQECTYKKDKSSKIIFSFVFSCLLLLTDTAMTAQNIATFTDKHGRFKVFDNGEIQDLEHEEITKVDIGGDYLIYKDNIKKTKRYANGEVEHITDDQKIKFYPSQYLMGIVEGVKGEILKVNYGGEEELLTIDLQPNSFAVEDSVLVFIDIDQYLSVYYNGMTEELTGRFPDADNFKLSMNSVAYVDNAGSFLIFHEAIVRAKCVFWSVHLPQVNHFLDCLMT